MKNLLFCSSMVIAFTLAISGCDSGNSGSDITNNSGSDITNNGTGATATPLVPVDGEAYVQKGPFQNGATVLVEELEADGTLTGRTWSTTTKADGKISFQGIGWEGLAMVTVEGYYFNEITGNYSSAPFILRAVMPVTDSGRVGNVNLFTHIIARYVEYWLPDGYSYDELREYADSYLADWFNLLTPPEYLNLVDSIDANTDRDSYILLLYSAAMASLELTQAELDQLADEFAQYDAGYYDDWPSGPGRTVLLALFKEVQENEASLVAQAREKLNQEFGRVIDVTDLAFNRVMGTICIYAGVLCENGTLKNLPIQSQIPLDVPVNVLHSGSYGFLTYFTDNGQNVDLSFSQEPGGFAIRKKSGTVSNFIEIMVRPVYGNNRYNLRFQSTLDKFIKSISMFRLSDGLPDDPYPLVVGENEVQVGVVWGTDKNTNSYYQLVAGPGRYRFSVSGFACGGTQPPVSVRGYQWDWDIRESLPVAQQATNPFENSASVFTENDPGCFVQFELENDTHPNQLYVKVEAVGLRDININTNRAVSIDFTIKVERI